LEEQRTAQIQKVSLDFELTKCERQTALNNRLIA
jgi:hypothetical protein